MSEAILDIDFVEEGDHILGLIFRVVDLFNAIEDDCENNLMRHNPSIIKKIAVTLLDTFDRRFKHMFGLTIDTHANGKFDSAFGSASEQRKQTVSCRVSRSIRILIEVAYFFLVDCDG